MHFLSAVSLVLALSPISSRAIPSPQDSDPKDLYVPLTTYEAFESPPPEATLAHLASSLSLRPAELYYLSVFYTYDTLSEARKAELTEERADNATIDDQVNLCMWTIPGDCWPLWISGNRREIQHGWNAYRKSGEKDYDQRMEYVSKGEAVAGGWARAVMDMQRSWRTKRYNSPVADGCVNAMWINGTSLCGMAKPKSKRVRDAWRWLQ